MARREVRIQEINDVWVPVIDEIRDANGLVSHLIHDDRAARDAGDYSGRDYQRTVMQEDSPMFAQQIARAASVLASIWLYEWHRAGSRSTCAVK